MPLVPGPWRRTGLLLAWAAGVVVSAGGAVVVSGAAVGAGSPGPPHPAASPGVPAGTPGPSPFPVADGVPLDVTGDPSEDDDEPFDELSDRRRHRGSREEALRPDEVEVPRAAKGAYALVHGVARPPKGREGRLVRYMVEVEKGLPFDPEEFAAQVHETLNDPRGWGAGGRMRFKRVDRGPVRFRVSLSSPAFTDRQCLPLRTLGEVSCWNGRRSVINARRWAMGTPGYRGNLPLYRQYVISHEVGHALGHGHENCPSPRGLAPVMTQQTISLQGCRPNPWPFPHAAKRERRP
ncbi:DUF3152 domain-containing protein [Sphaerisporangium album]|uniref:DUF3152 domain-containing protein n=1 Tax=Sphaerisporangium album TaxID=509200 RepID=A0A367FR47_9ACTN|nr:DUF3152 domain-containing protein [Sphaerisporangium album]RCG32704.1 DUF3152 domain-containing protein [Sphaerisporangium album]